MLQTRIPESKPEATESRPLFSIFVTTVASFLPMKSTGAQESVSPATDPLVATAAHSVGDVTADQQFATLMHDSIGLQLSAMRLPAKPLTAASKSTNHEPKPNAESVDISQDRHKEVQGASKRNAFGLGFFGDALAFGFAVAIDAMALMYTRSRRLLGEASERLEEKSLRQKIAGLHVLAPVPLFIAGFMASDALLGTGSLVGKAAIAAVYTASAAVMYAFSNNILSNEAKLPEGALKGNSLLKGVEAVVDKFGNWLINKMPSKTWALAMGVSVDAVISGFKFVQSSGWGLVEAGVACLIGGAVVYSLITAAQKRGATEIGRLINSEGFAPEVHVDRVAGKLGRATAAGFTAFRYFAWTGGISAGLILAGTSINEWTLRGLALGVAVAHGLPVLRRHWAALRGAKIEDANQFLGLRQIEALGADES